MYARLSRDVDIAPAIRDGARGARVTLRTGPIP
jgi:hypothetical protein